MRKFIIVLALCLSAVVFFSAPASAKEGFYFGLGVDFVNIVGSDPWWDTVDPGIGFDAKLGWDFGPVAIESSLIGSNHDDTAPGYGNGDFSGLTFDVRLLFGPSDLTTRGYLLLGLGSYSFYEYDDYGSRWTFQGGGFNIGGGLEHFFNDVVALDARAVYRIIIYDELKDKDTGITMAIADMDSDVFNLSIGLSFHF